MSPQNTTFPSNGSTAHGYLALPPSGTGPGLVVIQEWWGLTTHIEDVTNRFAAAGFVALAPDLYGGRTTHDGAEAETAQTAPRATELVADGQRFRSEIDGYVRELNRQMRETLSQELRRELGPKVVLAVNELRTRS